MSKRKWLGNIEKVCDGLITLFVISILLLNIWIFFEIIMENEEDDIIDFE